MLHPLEVVGTSYLADIDANNPLRTMRAAACTYRIVYGRARGRKCCVCKPSPVAANTPRRFCALIRTALAGMPQCGVVRNSVWSPDAYAAMEKCD